MAIGGVPICLESRSGIREAIEHGVNGLVVKDRADDFLAAVSHLQSDPAKWRQLSLAARETVLNSAIQSRKVHADGSICSSI
jgi:glycosyltransferase involved in cell wall biosynthesis